MTRLSITITIGSLLLTLFGLVSAVILQNPYWYSFFTVGSFFFIGSANRLLGNATTLPSRRTSWWRFVKLYLIYLTAGAVIDIVYGRLLGRMWIYPHFEIAQEVIHVIVVGYPFAFLSVVEMYLLCVGFFQAGSTLVRLPYNRSLLWVFLTAGFVALAAPPVIAIFWRYPSGEILFLAMVASTFVFDALAGLLGKQSLLGEVANRRWVVLGAVAATNLTAAVLHEVPNTYATEWVYQNVPFTNATILGVNVLILTFGWLFLVVIPVSIRNLVSE